MSSRLFTSCACAAPDSTIALADLGGSSRASAVEFSASARPISAVSGVRRSCEIAASSELRSRSDSI
jgi:hypothetical protein